MINFFKEGVAIDMDESHYASWISEVIMSEDKTEGEINYIFCADEYLLKINQEYLSHDTYTDIISFDNSIGNELHGDIFISVERVYENAYDFGATNEEELKRVMAHGILHFCGYKDKTNEESKQMRLKENEKIEMFHVER